MTDPGPASSHTGHDHSLPRKLTTIFCADVQGYSALVEADEVATVGRLKLYRADLIAEIEQHHGRVVNTWGDGLLADFPSPVEAVFAAVAAQRRINQRNAALRTEQPAAPLMLFRIGINLGDVMVDGTDLYGDGVNIAARLESLAEPGGVCISGAVFEQVRKKLDFGFDFIGSREIKNIAEPVPAYRIMVEGSAPAKASQPPVTPQPEPASGRPAQAGEAAQTGEATQADEATRIRKWRQMAWRFAVLGLFLLLINLATSPRSLWVFWPLLGFCLLLMMRYPMGVHPRVMWPLWRRD
ncbi:adenylate/guanylate cyclase domain-containing protein [Ferrovibrio sp.]|uniref:adenylate/guanylate cyclase domain-containing protein n=1 Tax=Ferrovibrio sp. TaxID=1917215 RepID=UPI0025BB0B45|nr:adenylate/guanylate cyclase domain-containing protein [Ferrovibrio sp.]MBX3454202.1 hypothetical protein [Ferrovibrio sp.]